MATALWDKFVTAIDYVRGSTDAAVAVHRRADSSKEPHTIASAIDTGSAPTAVPTSATAGANVASYATVNALVQFSGPQATANLTIYYSKNGVWYTGEDVDVEAPANSANVALPAIDTEGFDRVAIQVRATTATVSAIAVFPHNE